MKTILHFIMASVCLSAASGQITSQGDLAHTYSIVARDPDTGEMGVAVQSHWFSVGSIVSWGEAGVGVVATQSFVNPSFGPRGLELLKSGKSPQEAIDEMISADEGRDYRQVAIVDSKGRSACYSGKLCIKDAGHVTGENFSVQANMMLNDGVWPAMSEAFQNTKGRLAERLIAALEAAQNSGGDIRGKQSACLLVVRGESTGKLWEDRLIDLRVEDSPDPVTELAKLLKVHRAYEHMNNGDLAAEKNDMELAGREYSLAADMFPENAEMKFWHAVMLANNGKVEDSLPLLKEVFDKDPNWRTLFGRLPASGLVKLPDQELKRIMDL
ncbi:MAG: DUF1028 domain-containing protein [Ignavibacteria bacterium]|nr:DUF1028 domain-containing protein [Ignavibacteria bacterium]